MSKISLKIFVLFSVLLFSTDCFSQQRIAKYWNRDSLLTWNDFTGTIDTSFKFAAMTKIRTVYDLNFENSVNNVTMVTCVAQCFFVRNKSWSIIDKRGPELLAHEQLHFDIAEYFTRQFQKAVNERKFSDTSTLRNDIQKIYNEFQKKQNEMQQLYDGYSSHGSDRIKQKQWALFINNALDVNQPYEDFLKTTPL